jgi:Zn-dependent membrane protease YugP
MVPVLSIANNFPMLLMIGVMIMYSTGSKLLLTIGVALFAVATIFSFITLPVEFDASNRAIKWMQQRNIVTPREHEMAKDASNGQP